MWAIDSWKSKKALQLPEYPNQEVLDSVLKTLEAFPLIVFVGEARNLEERLREAALGMRLFSRAAIAPRASRSSTPTTSVTHLDELWVIHDCDGLFVSVGRMAGLFAKPGSDQFEEKNGVKLLSYRGDNVNGDAFEEKARIPDPERMIRAYCQSVATLNLLRAFATGGYAAMQRVTRWNLDFTQHQNREIGMSNTPTTPMQLDGAHVEFLRGVANPLGIKAEAELRAFFDVYEQEGSHAGGIHLEMTGQNVTECIGGSNTVTFDDLSSCYHTHCDPRLNASQSLELAFIIAERLRNSRIRSGQSLSL
ncbi:unnamed protein product [Lupinus luteus]|uniref:Phospho-2-dehydro-3-deoxyheptonate aldolase n=1 Tax=Lupinus luteus TaxID=3873 RepID=A0AAV1Y074_LUPLU